MARVSTYLNFPRSTEEAFLFYKSVFKSEFTKPIMRFGDIPSHPDQPPLAEADKNLVIHVELPILGGHVLMGTDAPESMGFTLRTCLRSNRACAGGYLGAWLGATTRQGHSL